MQQDKTKEKGARMEIPAVIVLHFRSTVARPSITSLVASDAITFIDDDVGVGNIVALIRLFEMSVEQFRSYVHAQDHRSDSFTRETQAECWGGGRRLKKRETLDAAASIAVFVICDLGVHFNRPINHW